MAGPSPGEASRKAEVERRNEYSGVRREPHYRSPITRYPEMSIINPWYHLGYVIPHLYTDWDAYQFYRVAPEGMMLVTTGLDLKDYTLASVEKELPVLWQRFELLASKKVNRIALSGVPVASALGRKRIREILTEGQARTGLPCDT